MNNNKMNPTNQCDIYMSVCIKHTRRFARRGQQTENNDRFPFFSFLKSMCIHKERQSESYCSFISSYSFRIYECKEKKQNV